MRYLAVLLGALHLTAGAEVFARIDPVTGHVTYTNMPPNSGIEQDALAPTTPGKVQQPARPKVASNVLSSPVVERVFPKVTPAEQRQRDVDRLSILHDELSSEKAAYAVAQTKKAGADVLSRHRANIASLERELARIR